MFADSFCDSGWSNRSHRRWTTLVSFALQALAVGCLLLLPLLYTQGLPRLALLAPLLAPAPPPALPPAPPHPNSRSAAQSNLAGIRLLSPSQIPPRIDMLTETAAPPPMVDSNAFGVSHGIGDRRGTVISSIPGSDLVLPPPSPPVTHHPPVSRMMEGNLILRVQPDYPSIARQARVQGQVVLRAMISREGTIENLQVLNGHPMLVRAAVDAVRQWRYRPYVLNGEPVEVETEVKVNFVLSGG
jgi:periplasmic protein TonB